MSAVRRSHLAIGMAILIQRVICFLLRAVLENRAEFPESAVCIRCAKLRALSVQDLFRGVDVTAACEPLSFKSF